ncbi:insulinase family protein, partial [Pseudomonas laurentiana]|nr:insulinase family protein [Pseudomonas laurentiana]
GLDRLLPAYLERTYGQLDPVEPGERRSLETVVQQAEATRVLTSGWLGNSAKLHWLFLEPALEGDREQTFNLLQRYLDWALYSELRLKHSLSYGPSSQREMLGNSSAISLNADLDRESVDEAEDLLRKMIDQLRQNGLDPATFERIKQAAIAREAWTTQGNAALADYYWSALGDYADGRFADPTSKLRQVSLEDANQAMRQLFAEPGYLRIERSVFGYDSIYRVLAGIVGLILLAGFVWHKRRTSQ